MDKESGTDLKDTSNTYVYSTLTLLVWPTISCLDNRDARILEVQSITVAGHPPTYPPKHSEHLRCLKVEQEKLPYVHS